MNVRTKSRRIPGFATEAEEARWWYDNRKELDKDLKRAAQEGRLRVLDRKTLRARIARSKARVISIRVPESDLRRARRQASALGLPYQTYIKSLLHQALEEAPKPKSR
jgi:predicted DNA binding CopG/RHH family protein